MGRRLVGNTRIAAGLGTLVVLGGAATALATSGGAHSATVRAGAATHKRSTAAGTTPATLTSGEQNALEAVRKAIAADTASIAKPILDKAVSAGTITSAQEQDLLTLLAEQPTGGFGGPGGHGGGMPPSGASG